MKNLTNNTENKGKIVAFHTGRGGRYFNAGHVSYVGQKDINEFTNDLFTNFENQCDIRRQLENYPNLTELLDKAIENDGNNEYFERFNNWFPLGELIWTTRNGDPVGLEVDNDGTGRIEIDGAYDTTTACHIEDCSDRELSLIYEEYSNLVLEYLYTQFNEELIDVLHAFDLIAENLTYETRHYFDNDLCFFDIEIATEEDYLDDESGDVKKVGDKYYKN